MGGEFKSLKNASPPTLDQIAARVFQMHNEVRALADIVGQRLAEMERKILENNALTDQVLEEMSLQIAFLMSQIRFRIAPQGAIAGPDGKVPVEIKTASQAYADGGRARLLAIREEYKRVQGLSTAETGQSSDPAAFDPPNVINGETRHDLIGDGSDEDDAETRH